MHIEKTGVISYAFLKDNNLQIKLNFAKKTSESV